MIRPMALLATGVTLLAMLTAALTAPSRSATAVSPITVVDRWTGFSTSAGTYDGVHPDDSGDQKISDRRHPALTAALGTATTPPTVLPAQVTCIITIVSQWPGGFQATVTVRNDGPVLTGWRVHFQLASTWTIGSVWNGTFSRSGTTVTVSNVSWNAGFPAGGSATAGFTAIGSGPLPDTCEPA